MLSAVGHYGVAEGIGRCGVEVDCGIPASDIDDGIIR